MKEIMLAVLLSATLLVGCLTSTQSLPVPTINVALPDLTTTPTTTDQPPGPSATPTPQGPPSDVVYADWGEPITLISGQRAVFNPGPAFLWFTNVSDSRCPIGVQCVWAGQVSVQADMQSGSAQASVTVVAGKAAANVTLNGLSYSVRLESITPYPKYSDRILLSEYRATFVVEDERNRIYSQYCQADSDCILNTELVPQCSHRCEKEECTLQTRLCSAYYRFSQGNQLLARTTACKQSEPCREPVQIQCVQNRCQVS